MRRHRHTKVRPGSYNYRGFAIDKSTAGTSGVIWIAEKTQPRKSIKALTLQMAKILIDQHLEQQPNRRSV